MTESRAIWQIIRKNAPRKTWLSVGAVYDIVEHHTALDKEDLELRRPPAGLPCWKTTVRRVLRAKQREGAVVGRRM